MANAKDERHRYGQHYTPREVATLLAAFAIRSPNDLVFDPSCGDGRLLEEALKIKKQLASQTRSTKAVFSDHVFGVERSPSAAQAARGTGANIFVADFFDIEPGAPINPTGKTGNDACAPHSLPPEAGKDACAPRFLPLEFDAIVGNPPYIRQEVIGAKGKRLIEARLALDRAVCPDVFWPRWSGRSDIYIYFFAHSICLLKKNARLVFLTASSWLDSGYGGALREFLLRNFRVIAVIESAAESFFADASINTCITVLERESEAQALENNLIRFVRFNRVLNQLLRDGDNRALRLSETARRLSAKIEREDAHSNTKSYRIRCVSQAELLTAQASRKTTGKAVDQGWGKYLRAEGVFFSVIERGGSTLLNLASMANIRFGVKTGANEFFYVRSERANGARPGLLALADVASVRRGITTGANEFFYLSRDAASGDTEAPTCGSAAELIAVRDAAGRQREIEAEMVVPVVFSLKEIPGIMLDRVQGRRLLFNCSLTEDELAGTRALEYIESGRRAGYHRRPTCSNRDPWYSVVRGIKPAPLIFPSKVGERWLIALNRALVFEDKKLYGVFPADDVSILVLAALLNSTWARYYAEVTCRQMTGAQAIADIDVTVAEQILLPDPRKLQPALAKKLESAIVELSRRPIYSIFEEIKRADRRRLDLVTLEAIGFRTRLEREAVLDQVYDAVTGIVRDRLSKSRRPREHEGHPQPD